MSQFIYTSLDLERPTFRLLLLKKGTEPDIRCDLIEASFEEDFIMPYEALSYTWGKCVFPSTILIDGEKMKVTSSLYVALINLRHDTEDRLLWVDAICINQSNDKEKTHQVAQMGEIYRQAERVLVWLGQSTRETDILMDCLALLDTWVLSDRLAVFDTEWKKHWDLIVKNQRKAFFSGSNCIPNFKYQESNFTNWLRMGLQHIFGDPWFQRVWILQEVANARRVSIQCGPKSILARTFSLGIDLIDADISKHSRQVVDLLPGARSKSEWWNGGRDLGSTLRRFAAAKATDERDRIFALLGVCTRSGTERELRADYSWPLDRVLEETLSAVFFEAPLSMMPVLVCSNFIDFVCNIPHYGYLVLQNAIESSDVTLVRKIIESHRHLISLDQGVWKCLQTSEKGPELAAHIVTSFWRFDDHHSNIPEIATTFRKLRTHPRKFILELVSIMSPNKTMILLFAQVLRHCACIKATPSELLQAVLSVFARQNNGLTMDAGALLVTCLQDQLRVAEESYYYCRGNGQLDEVVSYLFKTDAVWQVILTEFRIEEEKLKLELVLSKFEMGEPVYCTFPIDAQTYSGLYQICTKYQVRYALDQFKIAMRDLKSRGASPQKPRSDWFSTKVVSESRLTSEQESADVLAVFDVIRDDMESQEASLAIHEYEDEDEDEDWDLHENDSIYIIRKRGGDSLIAKSSRLFNYIMAFIATYI